VDASDAGEGLLRGGRRVLDRVKSDDNAAAVDAAGPGPATEEMATFLAWLALRCAMARLLEQGALAGLNAGVIAGADGVYAVGLIVTTQTAENRFSIGTPAGTRGGQACLVLKADLTAVLGRLATLRGKVGREAEIAQVTAFGLAQAYALAVTTSHLQSIVRRAIAVGCTLG